MLANRTPRRSPLDARLSMNRAGVKKRSTTRRFRMDLESLEPRLVLAGETWLINFQPQGAPLPNRYLADSGQVFGDRGGGVSYGWSNDHTAVARDRNLQPDQRRDTLVQVRANQNWEFQLPNGSYDVTVSIGDAGEASIHSVQIEGVSFWSGQSLAANAYRELTLPVTVGDGRLTLTAPGAADLATRVNYVHIQGLASPGNLAPALPQITEPGVGSGPLNPTDVHMEAIGFNDPDGNAHLSTDWEIWTTDGQPQRAWFTLGIRGVERLHTHLGDGIFENAHAGRTDLFANTNFELRVRFRDDAGSVSGQAIRAFRTGAASTIFPLEIEDVLPVPTPTWETTSGDPILLPNTGTILTPGDPILAIDLDGGSAYPGNESPANAVDRTIDKYLNFGEVNSGFIVTPSSGPSIVQGFRITTANDAEERDPSAWQLFGTNQTIISTDNSTGTAENWTLIASGTVNLPAARNAAGPIVSVAGTTAFASYRMVFTGVKNAAAANSMQIAEIQFLGELVEAPIFVPSDPILAIDLDGNSAFPGNETPQNAIDRTLAKYLNFGETRSGFIVTPSRGPTVVQSFRITTANDSVERDPSTWQLFGTNDTILSTNNSTGTAENWTLIDSGSVSLPAERNTLGPSVTVNNTTAYASYRMVITGVKNAAAANSMQFAEVQFFGTASNQATPPELRVESELGDLLLSIRGSELAGNELTNPPALSDHAHVRVVLNGGSTGLLQGPSDLSFVDDDGRQITIYLPNVSLGVGQSLYLWVSLDGSTYFGQANQTMPDFSFLARAATNATSFIATQANYVVEVVAEGLQLPVNIAFVPNPGSAPDDPKFYVTELYGTIKVVANNGTMSDYATGLLNFDPTGAFPGSGEQGLAGIAVHPTTGDVYVSRVTDTDGLPGGDHHPQVLRFTSIDGGRTAATQTVILNMVGETQGQSHQISKVTIGPDNKLYVHNGDGFDASTGLNLDSYRGKILRLNLDGSAPSDNPLYNASNGINSRDYIFAYGFRNPFGGAWRAADSSLYAVENGPSVDRMVKVQSGVNYGWDGSDASMFINALYNWVPAHAPVNITFVQPETFGGSQFPSEKQGRAFVSESGPTYAQGPQALGKRIVEFALGPTGNVLSGPTTLVEYVGTGRATIVGLAAGPDGLYFTDLYKDVDAQTPIDRGARVLRVRYVAPTLVGDFNGDGLYDCADVNALVANIASQSGNTTYDLNGDGLVTTADLSSWLAVAGSANLPSGNAYRLGDANLDGVVDGSDFGAWNANKFASNAGWCGGDFNADGVTDGSDFGIWNGNKFTSSDNRILPPAVAADVVAPWGPTQPASQPTKATPSNPTTLSSLLPPRGTKPLESPYATGIFAARVDALFGQTARDRINSHQLDLWERFFVDQEDRSEVPSAAWTPALGEG